MLPLAALVAGEMNVPVSEVMLLRHSGERIKELLAAGATVEDYTFTQPTGSRYDYAAPGKNPVSLVVVIVEDRVYGVYRVGGVEREGTTIRLPLKRINASISSAASHQGSQSDSS